MRQALDKTCSTSYTFSVISAAYNVELYLEETIQSIVGQDIGFEKNVQLIIVDDGSTDKTGEICDKYAALYPANIEVIHQNNAGVSAARNAALGKIRGRYVNFMDADDKFSPEVLRVVGEFLAAHGDETDVASIPVQFFEASTYEHWMNDKFHAGTRVVDLEKEPHIVTMFTNSAFIRREALDGLKFREDMAMGEDAALIQQLLLRRPRLGLVNGCKYLYRRRNDGSSAIQQGYYKKSYYMPYMQGYVYNTIRTAEALHGHIPLFTQYAIMSDLQWRFHVPMEAANEVLTPEAAKEWKRSLFDALTYISPDVIWNMTRISRNIKVFLLLKRENAAIEMVREQAGMALKIGQVHMLYMHETPVALHFLRPAKSDSRKLELRGHLDATIYKHLGTPNVYFTINGQRIGCTLDERENLKRLVLGESFETRLFFQGEFELPQNSRTIDLELFMEVGGTSCKLTAFEPGKFFPLINNIQHSYCKIGNHLAHYADGGIRFTPYSRWKHVRHELSFIRGIIKSGRGGALNAAVTRAVYWATKPFIPSDIWLLSDRSAKADDNAEAFFHYLQENKLHPHTYFAIKKGSPDFIRLHKMGHVIAHQSLKHQLYHLNATRIISSHADDHVCCYPKPKRATFYQDLFHNRTFVFLQHGIIENDLSGWLNPLKNNLSMFVTTTHNEYSAILSNKNYGYGPDIVKLTGLARHDRLQNQAEKIITIAPTWRRSLCTGEKMSENGVWKVITEQFLQSDFFRNYQALLSHPQLLATARELGYKIYFFPHPNMMSASTLFKMESPVEALPANTSYNSIFCKSSLMVTDYSSCVFDFAYLRKPVLYFQFDQADFFGRQWGHGYFQYERDGFGEVAPDVETTASLIIEYMRNDCRMKDMYWERADRFYAFNDCNNCQRVYNEVVMLGMEQTQQPIPEQNAIEGDSSTTPA